jgi:FlaA1/EpsC-like NDP-sugar epimerase
MRLARAVPLRFSLGQTIILTPLLNTHLAAQDWHAFLRRETPSGSKPWREQSLGLLAGKRVLITGAGGCIGSALAKALAQSGARELILLDSSEEALYNIHQALAGQKMTPQHFPSLASVGDTAAITNLFNRHQPEIVFHAAAFKHVPLMECNPFAAVANNALGTDVLAETSAKYRCEQLLMVSTDKAVAPSSIMGASKRIAELILLAASPTVPMGMKAIRLGNVLGSSGSVVPLFDHQIAQGGPVTVSHPDVRRYFMTLTEAVDALLGALLPETPDGVSVAEVGEPIRILDLAQFLIGQQQVPIVFTELRPGDKMEESLISPLESYRSASDGPLRGISSPALSPDELSCSLNDLRMAVQQNDLHSLLEIVQRMVPEYCPSLSLRTASAMVNA